MTPQEILNCAVLKTTELPFLAGTVRVRELSAAEFAHYISKCTQPDKKVVDRPGLLLAKSLVNESGHRLFDDDYEHKLGGLPARLVAPILEWIGSNLGDATDEKKLQKTTES